VHHKWSADVFAWEVFKCALRHVESGNNPMAVNTKTGTTEPNIILDDDKELQKPFVALYDKISSYDFDDK